MDQFFQVLRNVQKKERNNGTLTRVEETFYTDMHEYMDRLKQEAINDPFSKAPAILKEAQIIATDICQRRETKITNSAVLNIHRSYHLFTGKPQFDLVDTTPLNLTPEEEKLYYSLIDTLKNHRVNISLDTLSDGEVRGSIIKPKETQTNTLTHPADVPVESQVSDDVSETQVVEDSSVESQVSDDVSETQVVEDSSVESQVSDDVVLDTPDVKETFRDVKPKEIIKPPQKRVSDIEDNPNAFDSEDDFYDFESQKVAKDTGLVTMLVFDEVGAIVGVDEKTYGPFRPQDIVTLPMVNAKVFFKNRKGRQVKI